MKSVSILSQRIDSVTPTQIISFIEKKIKSGQKALIFAMNVHILVELFRNKAFQEKHNLADIIFCDGVPLFWMSKLLKQQLPTRVSGTDFVESLLQNKKNKVFLLGSTTSVLETIKKRYPDSVVGYLAPPFGNKWDSSVDQKIIKMIKRVNAEILLVGVGPLKQEKWLLQHIDKTNATIGVGVGSAFDILSGKTIRAPAFMQRFALEWVWRVMLEPRRLLGRYMHDMYQILCIIFSQKRTTRHLFQSKIENETSLDEMRSFYRTSNPDIFPTSINFSQGVKISKFVEKYRPKSILQIGCAFGVSSLWIEQTAQYPHNHTILELFPENIKKTKKILKYFYLDEKVKFIEGFSQVELGQLLKENNTYDFILHDGDNRFDGLMADIFFIHKLLKVNGIYVQRNLWNPSIREALSFVISNFQYKALELSTSELVMLESSSSKEQNLQKLGYQKLNDLIVLQKTQPDKRPWNHFKNF